MPNSWTVASEIFPLDIRMLCVSLTTADTWLGSFIIARSTPYMISDLGYGAYFFFGAILICMGIWSFFCVPETKGVPLESIYMLFEGNIIAGATRDVVPRFSRAKHLANSSNEGRYRDDEGEDDEEEEAGMGKDGGKSSHIERAGPAKQSAYGMNAAGAS